MVSEERERSIERSGDKEVKERRHRDRSKDRGDREKSHRHHRSSHHKDSHHQDQDRERDRHRDRDGNRKKRSRPDGDSGDHGERRRHHKSRKEEQKSSSNTTKAPETDDAKGEGVEAAPPMPALPRSKRDSWMVEPSADSIDYTQRGARKVSPISVAKPDYRPTIHKNELNQFLKDGKSLDEHADIEDTKDKKKGGVDYTFGDNGSKWRMAKLKRTYEAAAEEHKSLDQVAQERYGDFESFDNAREEEQELGRREVYGKDRRDVKEVPSGELYKQRMKDENEKKRKSDEERRAREEAFPPQGVVMETAPSKLETKVLDQSALNRMQAALMKAQMKMDPKAKQMEEEYNAAQATLAANRKGSEVVVLSAMDSRMLAGSEGRLGREVVEGKRGKLIEKEDMSIDDMVREEKRTRGQTAGGEGRLLAEKIARDGKFDDNLDYLDENAAKLAKRVQRSEIDLKNMAIHDFKKMQRVLDTCPLCGHEEENKPPIAPVISLGTRVFLTLPTEPEITGEAGGGAMIVPIQHRGNMLECDDDEWEEVRNFMKCLIRMYRDQGRDVIFYENAAAPHRKLHAAIQVVPLPLELGETAPAYFREAIMSADEEWSQHQKIINTLTKSKEGLGKQAFRRSLVKEMPYFHVWFEIDGGMGHIIEDANRWPKGDLFARELIGGMLDLEPNIIKKQGRWVKGKDKREEGFKKQWDKFDWTKVLYDA